MGRVRLADGGAQLLQRVALLVRARHVAGHLVWREAEHLELYAQVLLILGAAKEAAQAAGEGGGLGGDAPAPVLVRGKVRLRLRLRLRPKG